LILLDSYVFHYQKDRAKGIVVEQVGPTSAKLTWPDLANSTIDPELLSAFVVQYNSTYKNDPCQERTLVANIEVNNYFPVML
jgi:hypothetical protein